MSDKDKDIRDNVSKLLDGTRSGHDSGQIPSPSLKDTQGSVTEEAPKPPSEQPKIPKPTVDIINKIFKDLYDAIHDIHNKVPKKELIKGAAGAIIELFNNAKLRKNNKLPYKALLISNASQKQSKGAMKYDPFRTNIVIKHVLPNLSPDQASTLRGVMKDIPDMPFAKMFAKEEPAKEIPMVHPSNDNEEGETVVQVNDASDKTKIKQIQQIVKEKPGKAPTMAPAKQPEPSNETSNEPSNEPSKDSTYDVNYDNLITYKKNKDNDELINIRYGDINREWIEDAIKEGKNINIKTSKYGNFFIPHKVVKDIYDKNYVSKPDGGTYNKRLLILLNQMIMKQYGSTAVPTVFYTTYKIDQIPKRSYNHTYVNDSSAQTDETPLALSNPKYIYKFRKYDI